MRKLLLGSAFLPSVIHAVEGETAHFVLCGSAALRLCKTAWYIDLTDGGRPTDSWLLGAQKTVKTSQVVLVPF